MKVLSKIFKLLQSPVLLNKPVKRLNAQIRFKHGSAKRMEKEACLETCNVPKKSIWSMFSKTGKKKSRDRKNRPKEFEAVEFVTEEQAEVAMKKISEMGGTAYRTCGTAYILQKEHKAHPKHEEPNNEELILQDMLRHPSLKGLCDPMPPFESAELRMIQLSERKLHPMYRKLMSVPKQLMTQSRKTPAYKTRSGPVLPDEFPPHLKINREMYEKKNILFDYKRVEPPQPLLAKMLEIKQNERPQLKKQPAKKPT